MGCASCRRNADLCRCWSRQMQSVPSRRGPKQQNNRKISRFSFFWWFSHKDLSAAQQQQQEEQQQQQRQLDKDDERLIVLYRTSLCAPLSKGNRTVEVPNSNDFGWSIPPSVVKGLVKQGVPRKWVEGYYSSRRLSAMQQECTSHTAAIKLCPHVAAKRKVEPSCCLPSNPSPLLPRRHTDAPSRVLYHVVAPLESYFESCRLLRDRVLLQTPSTFEVRRLTALARRELQLLQPRHAQVVCRRP